jgi:hypothetical protein
MTQLRVCDGCSRHVFITEKACPFCGASLQDAVKRTFGERLRKGMSRAQMLAVAAAVTGQAFGACTDTPNDDGRVAGSSGTTAGTESSGGSSGTSGGAGAGSGGTAGTVSGGAGGLTGGTGGMVSGGIGGSGGDLAQPVYGAPVEVDAGADASDSTDAGDQGEGGAGGDGMAIPLYGATPVPR